MKFGELELQYNEGECALEFYYKGDLVAKLEVDETEKLNKWVSDVTWKMFGW